MRAVTTSTQIFFTVQIHILESLCEPYGDERVVVDAIDSIARAASRVDARITDGRITDARRTTGRSSSDSRVASPWSSRARSATRFSETSTRRDTMVLANARSMATAFGTARERERR